MHFPDKIKMCFCGARDGFSQCTLPDDLSWKTFKVLGLK